MGAVCTKVIDKIDKKWSKRTNVWTSKTYRIDSEMDGLMTSLVEICLGFEIYFTIQRVHTCTVIELYGTTESSFHFISAELKLFWKAFSIPEPKCEIKQQVQLPNDLLFNEGNPGWVKEAVQAKTLTGSSGKWKRCCQQVKASPKPVHTGVGSGEPTSTKKEHSDRHSVTDYSFLWKVESLDGNEYTCHFKNISNVKQFVEHVANVMEKPELKYSVTAVFVKDTPIINISQLETFLMINRDKNEFLMGREQKINHMVTVQVFNKSVDKNIKSLWLSPGSKRQNC